MEQDQNKETRQESRGREGRDGGEHSAPDGHDVKPVSRGRVVFVLVVLLVVAALLVVTGIVPRVRARSRLANQTDALAAPTVLVAEPGRGTPSQEVILPGNIQAFTDSPIYARTSGYLKRWYFDIGAHVKKGQLLAEIESPEVDQQLAQARADLATAEANAGNAQTNAKRYNDLLKSDAVSQQDVDNFNTQAASSNTGVKSAQANVERLQELVGFERITAPFDGVITARNVDTGQLISAGSSTELFHLAAVTTLRVYINVPQVYSRSATPGMTCDLTFAEFPGRRFQGKLVRTSGQIDPVSRTLLAEVDVDNRKGELVAGAYTEVHLKVKEGNPSYIVPVSALMYRSEGLRVGVVEPGNKAHLVPITIAQDDGKSVQILSGLDPNSQVIQNPPDSLIDGELVQVSPQRAGAEGQNPPAKGQGTPPNQSGSAAKGSGSGSAGQGAGLSGAAGQGGSGGAASQGGQGQGGGQAGGQGGQQQDQRRQETQQSGPESGGPK